MIRALIQASAVLTALLLAAPAPVHSDGRVLVIPKGSKGMFWKNVSRGAHQAGKDLGIRVILRGPATESHSEAQSQIIEYGIRKHYDAIVLAPNHVNKTAPALEKAAAAGIRIVLIDSNMEARYHASFVESDNRKAGTIAAEHMFHLLSGGGNVILARHLKNHASTHDREQGFLDTIETRYPQFKVVADPYVGASVGAAYRTICGILDRGPTIDAIFAVGEEATLGILLALKERDPPKTIRFIGFDYNAVIGEAILARQMDATIAQNPFQIGYLGVKTAYQLTRSETVPAKIYTDILLIHAGNYHTAEVQDIIQSNIDAGE